MQTCPNNCHLWARGITPNEPMTMHHPRCSRVDDTLMDVWRVTLEGRGCLFDSEPLPEVLMENPGATVEKLRMHREIFNATPEFAGW